MPHQIQSGRWAVPFIALATILSLTLFGCAKKKPTAPEEGESAPGVSPAESAIPPGMFPHPDQWETPSSHGEWVGDYGHDVCLKCHEKISATEESTATCASCHPLYPHKAGWVQKEAHGNAFLVKGRSACATQCHGYDLQGGLSGISCNLCHTIYPHTVTWAGPAEHGEIAKGDGKELCKGCHGDDLLGGDSGVSCTSCHALYPHTTSWAQGDQHGEYVLDHGKSACMTQCHGIDLGGGLSGVACDSCHNLYPHSDTWGQDHGVSVAQLGKGACQNCHGDDFKTVLEGQNCFSCHADYPHPDSALWLPFTGGHGEKIKVTYQGSVASCETCHGSDLKTDKQGQNCYSCHASYLHDRQSVAVEWNTYEGHGAYTLLNGKAGCQACHGLDYKGGNRGNPSCFTCHPPYPHLEGWRQDPGQVQEHGNYVQANGTTSCATSRCHGDNLVAIPGVSNGVGCDSCHANYPHPPNWISGLLHGSPARADINICKVCHGSGLDQAAPGHSTCKQCHPSYLRHQTADMGVLGWDMYQGHGIYVMNNNGDKSECQFCHGTDYLGGISNVSCKTCHLSYPHMTGWSRPSGQSQDHADYVHVTLNNNLTNCKVCHGNDLTGGISGQSCFDGACHANYPHAAISNWGQQGVHGPPAYGPGKDSCKPCHGNDFSGSPTATSCKDSNCHADFPHPDPAVDPSWIEWVASAQPVHVPTFVDRIMNQNPENCAECHGANYDRDLGGRGCTNSNCHPNGVTHKSDWSDGPNQEHGTYYSSRYTSHSTDANCWHCHDASVPFSDITERTMLCDECHTWTGTHVIQVNIPNSQQKGNLPFCYRCHWAYPHTSYNLAHNSVDIVSRWKPMPNNPPDTMDHGGIVIPRIGHVYYLMRSPLFTEANNNRPTDLGGQTVTDAVVNTCAGSTSGSCHDNGNRSEQKNFTSNTCGDVCH